MNITIEYMAQIKIAAGIDNETIDIESDTNLKEILNILCKKHGELFKNMMFENSDKLECSLLLALNDEQVTLEDDVNVKSGDRLSIISPMSGG